MGGKRAASPKGTISKAGKNMSGWGKIERFNQVSSQFSLRGAGGHSQRTGELRDIVLYCI